MKKTKGMISMMMSLNRVTTVTFLMLVPILDVQLSPVSVKPRNGSLAPYVKALAMLGN
jgi:hypothetical protein